jgi:hypothetical protein
MSVNRIFGANSVSGSGAGSLKDISVNVLTDGDLGVAKDDALDSIHFYVFKGAFSTAENYPDVIEPFDSTGPGRWFIIGPQYFMENLIVEAGNYMLVNEIYGNGSGLSLGFTSAGVDIAIGNTAITVTKDITTDSQVISTVADGTAPFVVASTTLVNNLNAEFFNGQPITNVSLLDDNTYKYTVIPQVADETVQIPSDPKDFITFKFLEDVVDGITSITISHNDLDDLTVGDPHTQYMPVTADRAFDITSFYPRINSYSAPNVDTDLTPKKYVDDEIAGLGLGGGGQYLLKDGSELATGLLTYDAGVPAPTLGNHLTDVDYVTTAISTHEGLGDPHLMYLRADGTRTTTATGRLHADIGDSLLITAHTAETYIIRKDTEQWFVDAFTKTELGLDDIYVNLTGDSLLSNIVRRDFPKSLSSFTPSAVETDKHSLATYGYLHHRLGNLIGNPVSGEVNSITLLSTGTGGFAAGTYTSYATTGGAGVGLQIRAFISSAGFVQQVFISSVGSGYADGDVVTITGGNGDTTVTVQAAYDASTDGAQHGDLYELDLDHHTQYSLVDGTRNFTGAVGGVSSTFDVVPGDLDGELATRPWVLTQALGGGGVADHESLVGVATSTAHDNYMYTDPSFGGGRGFTAVPFLDGSVSPLAPSNDSDLVTVAWVTAGIGSSFVQRDGSVTIDNNQIYNPKYPHDYFLGDGASELTQKDYVDTYLGLILVSDDDEYMGYLSESYTTNNPTSAVINDGATTAVELNITTGLKGTISRASIAAGGGTSKFFAYDDGSATYPDTFTVTGVGAGVTTTNITETYFHAPSNAGFNGTGARLIITVDSVGGSGELLTGQLTVVDGGYGFTNNDLVQLDYVAVGGTGSLGTIDVGTVGPRGNVIEANVTVSLGGSGYLATDELVCPNAATSVHKVIGDVEYFEIVDNGGGTLVPTAGDENFYVEGDTSLATRSEWRIIWAGGTITSLEQVAAGSGYTNTGTQLPIDQSFFSVITGGTLEIVPMVVGEVIDVAVVEQGFGYSSPSYNLTEATKASFEYGGFGTGGSFGTLDITYINANDEKVDDDWGHVIDVTESGAPSSTWNEIDNTDSPVSMASNISYFADTTNGTIEMRLPATPALGTTVAIDDYQKNCSVNNITVKNDVGGTPTQRSIYN